MSISTTASRFAVLKIEGDDEYRTPKPKNKPKPVTASAATQQQPKKGAGDGKTAKKKGSETIKLGGLAMDNRCTQQNSKKNATNANQNKNKQNNNKPKQNKPKGKPCNQSVGQEDSYERDLKEAIQLSQLDYEKTNNAPQGNGKKSKKKKSSAAVTSVPNGVSIIPISGASVIPSYSDSFMDFNSYNTGSFGDANMMNHNNFNDDSDQDGDGGKIITVDLEQMRLDNDSSVPLYEQICKTAMDLSNKEKKKGAKLKPVNRNTGGESVRTLQFQDDIEKKNRRILQLEDNVRKLQQEVLNVKERNKKLYGILGSGEMREKAELLVQVENLTKIKDELTTEVTSLHESLEQERSKVRSLQVELKKYKVGKK